MSTSGQLREALVAASPRLSPPATPLASLLIHACIGLLWLLLLGRAVLSDGLVAWSIGLVYVTYDTALLGFVFWQTRDLAGPHAPARRPGAAGPRTAPCRLGVVVAAHDEASVLPVTLAALFAQTEPPEVIVVADDGSSDGTAALLAGPFGLEPPTLGRLSGPSARHPTLHWLHLPHGGKPQALNSALLAIDTELVLTVDADTLLDPGAIAAMREAFGADPRLVAATGILTPVCAPTLPGRLFEGFQTYEYVRNFLARYAWMRMDCLLLISGAFAGFRTEAVRAVGGFDPACLVEDYELIHRLRRYGVRHDLGWTTAVVGGARALTDAPGSIGAFLRQRRRWFAGFLQTQFWYRDMVGNGAYSWLGRVMLPVKAADTMQPLYGLTAFGLLIVYAATGRLGLAGSVAGVMGAKILVDVAFHLWSIRLYRRWTGLSERVSYGAGLLALVVEPFSFQLLRHLGAAGGWIMVLAGGRTWGVQRRLGLGVAPPAQHPRPRDRPAGSAAEP